MPTDSFRFRDDETTVRVTGAEDELRRYRLETTARLRDDLPADGRREVAEVAGELSSRTGNDVFDALVALAMADLREASVASIHDAAFRDGEPVACDCFETGEKWPYVWTRDTAYAIDLALARLDPQRAMQSLLFKLSRPKAGGGLEIVQDTGSGGSWPISSDRVVWALGARAVLAELGDDERARFADLVYEAVTNTAERDRRYVFDAESGLYRGEQSFLDWREQSYPAWTAEDTSHIAMAKALSTNVAHRALLELAADLAAERGDDAAEARYRSQVADLTAAIERSFWIEGDGLYATFTSTGLDPSAVRRYDLLGGSLAVLEGVASDEAARSVVARYPRSAIGAPVMWPQERGVPIYHNRGMWPFVSAYSLLAARRAGNARVFDSDLESLVRGAALNLSNMENFDFATGSSYTDDGELSGPVVNSRRQLWSVAGYIAMVTRGVFGVEVSERGVRVDPFVTAALHRRHFAGQDRIELRNVRAHGVLFDVSVALPPCQSGDGAYRVARVRIDGAPVDGGDIELARFGDHSRVTVELAAELRAPGDIRVVDTSGDPRLFYAPAAPSIAELGVDGDDVVLGFELAGEEAVDVDVYRDGALIAEGIEGASFRDPGAARASGSHCYAIASRDRDTGTRSHHSLPRCHHPAGSVVEIPVASMVANGGKLVGSVRLDWGAPGDTLALPSFSLPASGRHLISIRYQNGSGPVNTGITAGVKWLAITDLATGEIVGEGPLVMPQRGDASIVGTSTPVAVELETGRVYALRLTDGVNMSRFDHFTSYGGAGGGPIPENRVGVVALRVVRQAARR